MKTYLLFFGKSQDFIFFGFDKFNAISDFNSVIKDFDLLESPYFTSDDISNKEILSKYNFVTKSGDRYSLLKLYSLAQAFDGHRIAGCTYGVALLSDNDLLFSKNNVSLLKVAKENFAKLSLNGLKFNKSNFKEDAYKIWNAIVNSKDGNYLDTISYGESLNISSNLSPRSYFVNSIYDESQSIEDQIQYSQKIYISSDLDHLKRTQSKWGENFPIFVKAQNNWVKYVEHKLEIEKTFTNKVNNSNLNSQLSSDKNANDISKIKTQISDLQYERDQIITEAKVKIGALKKKNTILLYLNFIQISIIIILLLFSLLKKTSDSDKSFNQKDDEGIPVNNEIKLVQSDISNLLNDSTNFQKLTILVDDIERLKKTSDSLEIDKIRNQIVNTYTEFQIDTNGYLFYMIEQQYKKLQISKNRK